MVRLSKEGNKSGFISLIYVIVRAFKFLRQPREFWLSRERTSRVGGQVGQLDINEVVTLPTESDFKLEFPEGLQSLQTHRMVGEFETRMG